MITEYLNSVYKDGGRGNGEFDCYGMTRHALHYMYGGRLLPEYGYISANDKTRLTDATENEVNQMKSCAAKAGVIATAWDRGLCTHIAIVVGVDGRPMILETNEKSGPRLTNIKLFLRRFTRVIYYCD